MRKISRLSLVAAVAVAGFSTASAQPLEEAIKNVEVSGSVVYRYDNWDRDKYGNNDDANANNNRSTQNNRYKVALNLSSKVNDDVKFNSRFLVAADNGDFADLESHQNGGDVNPGVTLSHANFAYTGIKNTTVIAGKQGLATPWTMAIDSDGQEHTGTGLLALTTWGPVTAGAGYFNQNNLDEQLDINPTSITYASRLNPGNISLVLEDDSTGATVGDRDLYVATLQADLSPVKLEAWYLNMVDVFDSYTLVASANFKPADNAKFGVEARYVNLELENGKNSLANMYSDDNAMWKLTATGAVGIVNAKISYTQTDEDGGLTALDKDAQNTTLGWTLTPNGIPDAKMWDIRLGVNLLDNLELAGYYGHLESDGNGNPIAPAGAAARGFGFEDYEASEWYINLGYKMSKNLMTYVRYGNIQEEFSPTRGGDVDDTRDQNMGRLQIEDTF